MNTAPGRDLLERFAYDTTPTYLVFNARGEETLRVSTLPSIEAVQAAGGV
ncbi:hypothetical protein HC776_01495 [bacterium]|nr:hypothetical protein [bacterium]